MQNTFKTKILAAVAVKDMPTPVKGVQKALPNKTFCFFLQTEWGSGLDLLQKGLLSGSNREFVFLYPVVHTVIQFCWWILFSRSESRTLFPSTFQWMVSFNCLFHCSIKHVDTNVALNRETLKPECMVLRGEHAYAAKEIQWSEWSEPGCVWFGH